MAYNFSQTGQQIQTIINKSENTDNKITSPTAQSTDTQYPSAKAVYDFVEGLFEALGLYRDADGYICERS